MKIGSATTATASAQSVIDAVVFSGLTHYSTHQESVDYQGGDWGTSFAGPRAASLGMVVKDFFIATGNTWFNQPGWVHLAMLAMTDRHRPYGTGTAAGSVGGNVFYGFGRAKLQMPGAGAFRQSIYHQVTLTSASQPFEFLAFSRPLATDTEFVKCVSFAHEDMTAKDYTNRQGITVKLRAPDCSSGPCVCDPGGAVMDQLEDWSVDVKHMVALEEPEAALVGNCLYIEVRPIDVVSSIPVQTLCTAGDATDGEPD